MLCFRVLRGWKSTFPLASVQRCRSFSTASEVHPHDADENVDPSVWPVKQSFDFRGFKDFRADYEQACRARNMEYALAHLEKASTLYDLFLKVRSTADSLRSERKSISKGKISPEKIERGKILKQEIQVLEKELSTIETDMNREAALVPNLVEPNAYLCGTSPKVVCEINEKPQLGDDGVLSHVDISKERTLIDFEGPALSTGNKFYALQHEIALLELALIQWSVQTLYRKEFTPLTVPDMVKVPVIHACGYQPRTEASQTYHIEGASLGLSGTAELAISGMHANRLFDSADLPKKFVGFSHCFRTEIGAAGLQTKGIYRVHQFSKVEMYGITPNDMGASMAMYDEFVQCQKELFGSLGLHFQVLQMPPNDLGAPAYCKTDIEAWFPGRQEYGEISSTSNCTEYQSRRLNIRYRPGSVSSSQRKTDFVHTINGTAAAVPRLIVAIMENFQHPDGYISVPQVLVPYMGGVDRIETRSSLK